MTPDSPKAIFLTAEAYFKLASLGIKEAHKGGEFAEYFIYISQANIAFACELYLKSIITEEKSKYGSTHDLKILFNSLSVASRKGITEIYDEISENSPKSKIVFWHLDNMFPFPKNWLSSIDFRIETVLNSLHNDYDIFRFYFEPQRKNVKLKNMAKGKPNYHLYFFSDAVREYITKKHPAWPKLKW